MIGHDPVEALPRLRAARPGAAAAARSTASIAASASGSRRARPTLEEWHEHLSTLFPEVRPRGHLELRSADAVPPQWFAAPVALAVGITYDPGRLRAAADLLGRPDMDLLHRAAGGASTMPTSGGSPWIWSTSRSRAAGTWAPGTSIHRIWSRPASSSTSTPAGAARRPTTSKARRSRP